MSSVERERKKKEFKFTRGEKCIFIHLVITFTLIVILVIIYFTHLCLVSHKGNDMYKIARTRPVPVEESPFVNFNFNGVGVVYLKGKPTRALCNTFLVHTRRSVGPGLCAAARAEPHLSDLLPYWSIKYRVADAVYAESDITRSVTHPHFNKDDLNNNIGYFEHGPIESITVFSFLTSVNINLEDITIDDFGIFSWELLTDPQAVHKEVIVKVPIKRPMSVDECKMYVSPVTDLREHEFCIEMNSDLELVNGALLLQANRNIIGFISWGQTQSQEDLPAIVLNITSFKEWLEYVIF